MNRRLGVPDVEAMLMRSLLNDRKHAEHRQQVQRVGFDVVVTGTTTVPVSGLTYGRAIWLEHHTGEPVADVLQRLGQEVEDLVAAGVTPAASTTRKG